MTDYWNNSVIEENDGNNTKAFPITMVAPDLVPTAAGTTPAAMPTGSHVTVQYTVANQSNAAIPATAGWTDTVYLSTDDHLNPTTDTWLASASISGPLGANAAYSRSLGADIPQVAPGNYYLIVVTDDGSSQVSETIETNNTVAFPITVVAPDLTPTLAELIPASGLSGQPAKVRFSVANQGAGPAVTGTSWADAVYLSNDTTLSGDDIWLGDAWTNGPLPPGSGYTQTIDVNLPEKPPGTYYLIVVADYWSDALYESNESNNKAAYPVTLVAPDLRPVDLGASPPPLPRSLNYADAGETFDIQYTVRNDGNGLVPADASWVDRVYLSTDMTLDTSDLLLSEVNESGALAVGGSYTRTVEATAPMIGPGRYYLILAADSDSGVFESARANNILIQPIDIHAPDLVPTAASLTPSSAQSGATVSLSYTVSNRGTGVVPATQAWEDHVYLSADTHLSGDDIELASTQATGPVAAGGSYTITQDVILPSVATGNYYLIVVTDGPVSSLFESDETNNVALFSGTLFIGSSDYDIWAHNQGLSGTASGNDANPSGDGIDNLLKYAFNMNPAQAATGTDRDLVPGTGTSGLPATSITPEARLQVEFVRRRSPTELIYQIEFCTSPGGTGSDAWQPASGTETVVPIDANWERVTVQDESAPPDAPTRFVRVCVSR